MVARSFRRGFPFFPPCASPFFSERQLGGIIRGSAAQEPGKQGSPMGKLRANDRAACRLIQTAVFCATVRLVLGSSDVPAPTGGPTRLHNLLICDVIARPVGHLVDEARSSSAMNSYRDDNLRPSARSFDQFFVANSPGTRGQGYAR